MDVSLREYPDLRVTEIGDPPLGLRPGQKIDVSWTIINEGNSDTRRDWVDYVYLSDDVAAINDDFVDGSEDVTITAEATDYEAHTAALRISEDDQPALTVTIGAAIFAENVANPATTATVRRNTDTTDPLEVTLRSDLVSKATVPETVTIPAGQDSVVFDITAVDNTRIDGTGQVTILATATGFQAGIDTVVVTDDDIPQLTVTFATPRISESSPSPATIGTITRSVASASELNVVLTSLDPSEVLVPGGIRITPGQTSDTFQVFAVDDDLNNRLQIGTILAQIVTDTGAIEITWRVNNDGLSTALGSWVDRIYLSTDTHLTNSELIASVAHAGPLPAGEFYEDGTAIQSARHCGSLSGLCGQRRHQLRRRR